MKKNSVGAMFLRIFIKSLFLIAALILVGYGSYKGVLYFYGTDQTKESESTTGVPRQEEEDGQDMQDTIVTALYGDDSSTKDIDYIMVKTFNVNTKNLDYIMIPNKTKITLSQELFNQMTAKSQDIPQMLYLNEIGKYFATDEERYEMTNLALEEVLGIEKVDYYEAVNQESFVSLVNLLPPQEMDVPLKMVFKDSNGINVELNAGVQTLSGDQVLGLLRFDKDYANGELDRIQTNITYFRQYLTTTHSFSTRDELLDYMTQYYELVKSNSGIEEAKKYLEYYYEIKPSQIYFNVIEGKMEGTDYILDDGKAKQQVSDILSNEVYSEPQEVLDTKSAAPVEISSKGLNIAIYNSTRTNGLASKWETKLKAEGFTISKKDTDRNGTLEHAKIIVSKENMGKDLLEYFPNATIEIGTLDAGTDIKIIIGTSDIF